MNNFPYRQDRYRAHIEVALAKAARRSCFFLKGDMPIINPLGTLCPDIWDDGRPDIWLNPWRGLNPKYRGTGTMEFIAPFRK